MDTYRNSENFVKCDVSNLSSFDGGLNFAKRWVAAVLDIRISPGHGVVAALT